MPKLIDLTNQKFGRLVAIEKVGIDKQRGSLWKCVCDCSNLVIVRGRHLQGNRTKSCGCLVKDRLLKHGQTGTITYRTWSRMLERCTNKNRDGYSRYGGRGIKVCEKWLNSFNEFYKDMGEKPNGLTLERIDNDKEYSKENCEWATPKTQARNRGLSKKNTTGVSGVSLTESNTYRATIGVDLKAIYLGCFKTLKEATFARKCAEVKYWNK